MLNIPCDVNQFEERDRVYFCFYSFTLTHKYTNICIISSYCIVTCCCCIMCFFLSKVCVFFSASRFSREKSFFFALHSVGLLLSLFHIHIVNIVCASCLGVFFFTSSSLAYFVECVCIIAYIPQKREISD